MRPRSGTPWRPGTGRCAAGEQPDRCALIDAYERALRHRPAVGGDHREPDMPPMRDRLTMARRVRSYVTHGKTSPAPPVPDPPRGRRVPGARRWRLSADEAGSRPRSDGATPSRPSTRTPPAPPCPTRAGSSACRPAAVDTRSLTGTSTVTSTPASGPPSPTAWPPSEWAARRSSGHSRPLKSSSPGAAGRALPEKGSPRRQNTVPPRASGASTALSTHSTDSSLNPHQTCPMALTLTISAPVTLGLPDGSPAPHRASYGLLEGKRRVSGARQPQSHAGALLGDVRRYEAHSPWTRKAPPGTGNAPSVPVVGPCA